MKIYICFLFFLFTIVSFSQKIEEIKFNEAKEAYEIESYEEANLLIENLKSRYKSIPPKVAFLEIMIKSELLK